MNIYFCNRTLPNVRQNRARLLTKPKKKIKIFGRYVWLYWWPDLTTVNKRLNTAAAGGGRFSSSSAITPYNMANISYTARNHHAILRGRVVLFFSWGWSMRTFINWHVELHILALRARFGCCGSLMYMHGSSAVYNIGPRKKSIYVLVSQRGAFFCRRAWCGA